MLKCKECGVFADQLESGFKKNCACECGVIMDMGQVKLKGIGTVKEKNTLQEILDALIDFITKKYKALGGKI